MNFTTTAVIIASAGILVNGFCPSSFIPSCRRITSIGDWGAEDACLTVLKSSADDKYTSLLEKLSESSESKIFYTANTESGNVDALHTLVDAVASTSKAINDPVSTYENVLKIPPQVLSDGTGISSFINVNAVKTEAIPAIMADAQTKLSVLQQQLKDINTVPEGSNGFDLAQLSAALSKALDVSIHAAEQATESSLAVVAGPFDTETISHIMAQTQSKLSVLEQQLHDTRITPSANTELDLTQLYAALNKALDSSFQAAEKATEASLEVVSRSIDTEAISQVMAQTQSKLSALEQQLHDIRTAAPVSNDVDLTQLYAALNEAHDVSSNIAKYASTYSSAVTDELVQLNVALGHSMSNIDLGPIIPPEIVNSIRIQIAGTLDGPARDLEGVIMNWNHALVQSFMNGIDRKFHEFSLENAFSSDASVVMAVYGLFAFMLGYSQNMGVAHEGKFSVDKKLANDIDNMKKQMATPESTLDGFNNDTAENVPFRSSNEIVPDDAAYEPTEVLEPTILKRGILSSVDYDAAARLAYKESGLVVDFYVFKSLYLAEAAAMVAKKNPYVKLASAPALDEKNSLLTVDDIAAPRFEYQDPKESYPEIPNPPLVSPLARSLAEEMGLELTRIGAGSGKNGKIVAEDVRNFKSKMEQANGATSQEAVLFSTANA